MKQIACKTRKTFLLATLVLASTPVFAQNYTDVYLSVSAPKVWYEEIAASLKIKLNAIPDVQVVDKEEDSAFTVSVDVNAVMQDKDVVGYSMMALIYGTYDRRVLNWMFDLLEDNSKDKDFKSVTGLMKYVAAGNVFLAAAVHTHGSLQNIDTAYDEIVGQLKTKALPELRRFQKLVAELDSGESKKPLPRSRF